MHERAAAAAVGEVGVESAFCAESSPASILDMWWPRYVHDTQTQTHEMHLQERERERETDQVTGKGAVDYLAYRSTIRTGGRKKERREKGKCRRDWAGGGGWKRRLCEGLSLSAATTTRTTSASQSPTIASTHLSIRISHPSIHPLSILHSLWFVSRVRRAQYSSYTTPPPPILSGERFRVANITEAKRAEATRGTT